MVVGEHEIQTFEVVVLVLFSLLWFDVFVPSNAHTLLFLDNLFVNICLNVSFHFYRTISL